MLNTDYGMERKWTEVVTSILGDIALSLVIDYSIIKSLQEYNKRFT